VCRAIANGHADHLADGDRHPHGNGDIDGNIHGDADVHGDGHRHIDADGHTDLDIHCDADVYPYPVADANPDPAFAAYLDPNAGTCGAYRHPGRQRARATGVGYAATK